MASWTWDPFQELEALRQQLEQVFEDYRGGRRPFSRTAFLPGQAARSYPLLNLNEDTENVYLEALAPGLDPESLDVTVRDDVLRVAGEKPSVNPDIKAEAFHRNERSAGRFVRTLSLPASVDAAKVKAKYANGLLTITLPKAEEAKPKQIEVAVS
ncbi:MAG: Hsp20/alpha crystallin family protein [Candidatus Hydrogenedentota bacterium]